MAVRSDDLNDAKAEAQLALFGKIKEQAETVASANMNVSSRSASLRDLALAYRYAAGGQQPGAVTVEN